MLVSTLIHLRQKFQTKSLKITKSVKNEQGQSFVEFLFLLLVLMGLSITMITGFNNSVAKRWKAMVEAVAIPNNNDNFEL